MTTVALLTDRGHIAALTEWSAVVAVDTRVVDIEETPTGDTLEVLRVPGLTQGLDGVLGGDNLLRLTVERAESKSPTLSIKPLQAAQRGTNIFL